MNHVELFQYSTSGTVQGSTEFPHEPIKLKQEVCLCFALQPYVSYTIYTTYTHTLQTSLWQGDVMAKANEKPEPEEPPSR